MLNKQKGFTLIELLVVIVVIGILIALTLPNLFAAQERARDTQRKNDLSNISQQLETYYNDNQTYPTAMDALVTDGYLDEVPSDPNGSSSYEYAALANDGTDTCDGDGESVPCAEYTITVDLENENDPDTPDDSAVYEQTSINQASNVTTP